MPAARRHLLRTAAPGREFPSPHSIMRGLLRSSVGQHLDATRSTHAGAQLHEHLVGRVDAHQYDVSMIRRMFGFVTCAGCIATALAEAPAFTAVQPDSFTASHALSNAFADFNGDGSLDLAVSFQDGAIRLYRNDTKAFVDVGAALGLPTAGPEVRGLSWGDFDGDGDPDLYAGVSGDADSPARNLMFRNDGGNAFVEVAEALGLNLADRKSVV